DEAELVRTAKAAMAAQRQAERARGRTLVGPHRDEITLEVDRRLLRLYGSRGQQVAAALALRLAERELLREETGEDPVLLLDDVMMTLDERRQGQLIAFARGAQVLTTVTTLAALAALPAEAAVFHVTGGTVEAPRSAEEHREHERLELSAQKLAAIDQTVAEIADPELREAARRAMRSEIIWRKRHKLPATDR